MHKFGDFTQGYYDVKDQLSHYLLKKAEAFFEKEALEKSRITTVKEFEKRRKNIKNSFLAAIGGLPGKKTPLNPICSGVIKKENYRIEKIVFQSQPEFYVTSNLYVPEKLKGKAPGILLVCGHAFEAKSYPVYQKVCIDLVNNGFVVLTTDPIGQGERMQYYNPKTKKTDVEWGVIEHSYAGAQNIIEGSCIARYFIWDGIRGIDYLISRPEVDKDRIGITGNSGGGTQTSYLMMTDERIKCAVPCTYLTNRYEYMKTMQSHDAEQNIFGAVKNGFNHDDIMTALAPKPVQIGAVSYDFFCIEGTIKSFERAKKIYSLYGAGNNINLVIDDSVHLYSDVLRQASVNWFKKHLKNEPMNFVTSKNIATEEPAKLNCTQTGQILDKFPDSNKVYNLNETFSKENAPERNIIKTGKSLNIYIEETRAKLINLLQFNASREKIFPRIISSETTKDHIIESLFFFAEKDIIATAYYFKPLEIKTPGKTYILLLEGGTSEAESKLSIIKSFTNKGYSVLVFDPRGVGAVKNRNVSWGHGEIYCTEFKLNYDTIMMGTSLMAMRVFDITRGVDYLYGRKDVDKNNIGIIGYGAASIWALCAGILQPKIKELILNDMLFSYQDIIETRLFKYDNKIILHGFLKNFDLVDLIPCFSGKYIKLVNLKDAGGNINKNKLNNKFVNILKTYYPAYKVNINALIK